MQTFNRFFFASGRFPTINKLTIVPTGDMPSFVRSNNVRSPSELYKRLVRVRVMLED